VNSGFYVYIVSTVISIKEGEHIGNVIVSEYVTLDGIKEEPGTPSFPFWNEEASQFKFEELRASEALLLEWVTYHGFAKAWPTMTDIGSSSNVVILEVQGYSFNKKWW
jgi:hypothetical protein